MKHRLTDAQRKRLHEWVADHWHLMECSSAVGADIASKDLGFRITSCNFYYVVSHKNEVPESKPETKKAETNQKTFDFAPNSADQQIKTAIGEVISAVDEFVASFGSCTVVDNTRKKLSKINDGLK